ncbi:xylulokinase [Deinococcus yavapaiensis]|uniref:Xylulose kinase n=1 Tax=Deinococcus yavapaiensis KR-236 TaxID=694435 RepID=A0A318SEK0_9DEIO|nr:xylulokinase [Deinococcus yavapaiensis]PYE54962.1 xylulokinase [Deinococcus yavapaiensis KR-236]
MTEGVTLGVDVGTSGVKVVALTRRGEVIAEATRSYPLHTPRPGWTQQDPSDWVRGATEALRDVASNLDGRVPLALGLSGQMHGLVPLDGGGDVIRPAMLWNDARTGAQVEAIEARVSRAELVARTGNRAVAGFQLPKILWLRDEEPQAFARLRCALLPKDYLGFVLTGQKRTEPSDASGVGALHLASKSWDRDVLSALDLDASLFPDVIASHEVVGTLSDAVAQACGLPRGLLVVAGGGDNAAAGVGLGLTSSRRDVGSVSLGTSGVIFAPLSDATPDPEGRVHLFAHADGGYHLLGVTLSAAGALQWLKDKIAPEASLETLLEEARGVGSSQGVTFLPYLAGERSPWMDPALRGSWSGLSLAHERGHLTRAVLEGVAFSLADAFDVMRPLSHVETLLATGGGARSDLWLGLVSGALDKAVRRPSHEPGAAHGAAILAMPAAGLYASLEEAMDALRPRGDAVAALPAAAEFALYRTRRDLERLHVPT